MDRKGKIRNRYEAYLTPYEKLKSLPPAEQYLRPGWRSWNRSPKATAEYALLVKQAKSKLFRSFAPRATVP
mgnify:CR=1 FL=1